MKLTHLGNQYTPVTTDIETVETETELRFLGRTFKRRAPKVVLYKFPSDSLIYRGVNYKV